MNPRVIINKKKLLKNYDVINSILNDYGIEMMLVTKVLAGNKEIIDIFKDCNTKYYGDSRLENLRCLSKFNCKKVLIRIPMISRAEEVVKTSDISFNSELSTIKELNFWAKQMNVYHGIVIMVDLGDLREGILYNDLKEIVVEISKLENINIVGIAVNLTCYGGVIPDKNNLGKLVELKNTVESIIHKKLKLVSGGNSSSIDITMKKGMPKEINNLRIGEGLFLGRETAYGNKILGTYQDVFQLEVEIIELKDKPSLPFGQVGMDAFGNKPEIEDKGRMKRAILAIGKQDVDYKQIFPLDRTIKVLGSSSDHLILDITNSNLNYKVGDVVKFNLTYASLLSLMSSNYVNKEII